jgi:hypothetical protein
VIASRMAAKSTTAGTPVKSCRWTENCEQIYSLSIYILLLVTKKYWLQRALSTAIQKGQHSHESISLLHTLLWHTCTSKNFKKFRSVKEIANLENDTSRFKWDFHLFGSSPLPVQDFFHICLEDLKIITIPNCRFQQISDGVGQCVCTHTHTHTVINPKY